MGEDANESTLSTSLYTKKVDKAEQKFNELFAASSLACMTKSHYFKRHKYKPGLIFSLWYQTCWML